MFERNRNPSGLTGNIIFGLASILDGLIRVLSLGFFHGRHRFTPLRVTGRSMQKYLAKRSKREANH